MAVITPIFTADPKTFSGSRNDYLEVPHSTSLALTSGTIALSFTAASVSGRKTLFSKDGRGFEDGGHLTFWIQNGHLKVRQQSDGESKHIRLKDIDLNTNQTYHLAVSFGDDGLKIYLNGELVAAEPTFVQGMEMNTREMLFGASGMHRSNDNQSVRNPFEGTMDDIQIFNQQLSPYEIAEVAGQTNPIFQYSAELALATEALMPVFAQAHHGSDALKELAKMAGFKHDGSLMDASAAIVEGTDGDDPALMGTDGDDHINGLLGDDVIDAKGGNDVVQGSYGNDEIIGGEGHDVLDGGHGEDIVNGGAGNDILISQSDGREWYVAYDPNRDEGIDADSADQVTGKVYLDQPIHADDRFTGGEGADIFYFQTLINAKQKYIEKHTKNDGTIKWHGVAGENNNVHDHWVDWIGNDVITDFNRAEGDQIIIEGHTTEIQSITHGDINDDGVIDHSIITLYSQQGAGGGAHDEDHLGTITVFGDLVTENDIQHTAKPAYGIVNSIDSLDEALSPIVPSIDTGPIAPPDTLPSASGFTTSGGTGPVFAIAGAQSFNGKRGTEFTQEHRADMALAEATIAFSFTADDITGRDTLFSKDARTFGDGGHLTAWVKNGGHLEVRFQSDSGQETYKIKNVITEGQSHDFAMTFGEEGVSIYLDGNLVASDKDFTQGWETNKEFLLIGGNGWASKSGEIGRPSHQFDGEIQNFVIYGEQLNQATIQGLPIFQDQFLI